MRAEFVPRIAGVEVCHDKWATLDRLEPPHRKAVEELGFRWEDLWRAEQVHGDGVAVVPDDRTERMVPGVDGLLTATPGVVLGIYVADCAAVYLVDRSTGALGLVHSGRKGTEAGIVGRAIAEMERSFGSRPGDLEVALSPCIRPPNYEVDIVEALEEQLRAAGVPEEQVSTSGVCTGEAVADYYSYRVERGCTGRMLALLGRVCETGGAP